MSAIRHEPRSVTILNPFYGRDPSLKQVKLPSFDPYLDHHLKNLPVSEKQAPGHSYDPPQLQHYFKIREEMLSKYPLIMTEQDEKVKLESRTKQEIPFSLSVEEKLSSSQFEPVLKTNEERGEAIQIMRRVSQEYERSSQESEKLTPKKSLTGDQKFQTPPISPAQRKENRVQKAKLKNVPPMSPESILIVKKETIDKQKAEKRVQSVITSKPNVTTRQQSRNVETTNQ